MSAAGHIIEKILTRFAAKKLIREIYRYKGKYAINWCLK